MSGPDRCGEARETTDNLGMHRLLPCFHPVSGSCWTCLRLVTLLVAVPGRVCGAVEDVVVVFKTHFDIGYTNMASNVVQRYRTTMIDEALSVVEQNRDLPANQQFVWTLAGWPMTRILKDGPG